VRPQRFGDGASAQHAPAHLAAHLGQTRAEIISDRRFRQLLRYSPLRITARRGNAPAAPGLIQHNAA
jgi:hypothetical protein